MPLRLASLLPLLAAVLLPLILIAAGGAIRLAGWPEQRAAAERREADGLLARARAAWDAALAEHSGDPAVVVLGRDSGPFASVPTAPAAEPDPATSIVGDLVARAAFLEALAYYDALSSNRKMPAAARWMAGRAHAGLGEHARARTLFTAAVEVAEDGARFDGLPLAGLIALHDIRAAVALGNREAAITARDGVVGGRSPVPAFSAAILAGEWRALGIALDPARETAWLTAAEIVLDDGLVGPGRVGSCLVQPGLAADLRHVIPEPVWRRALAAAGQTADARWRVTPVVDRATDAYAELGLAPGIAVVAEPTGLLDSTWLAALSWLLPIVGGVLFATANLLLWRVARRDVALSKLRQAFVDQVSHDLRTPLTALLMKSELLARGQVPAGKERSYERSVHRDAKRLAEVVEGVLDFARLEQGAVLPTARLGVRDVVAEAVWSSREALARHGQRVRVSVPRTLPALLANRGLVVRALRNLVENAARLSAGRPEPVEVRVEPGADRQVVYVTVLDRGPGLGVGDPAMLFEPYRQGVDAGPREAGGVGGHGLGLAVVAQTASAHGGSVEAQNRGGGGAAFRITLPCDRRGAA